MSLKRKITLALLACVFVLSSGVFVDKSLRAQADEAENQTAVALVELPDFNAIEEDFESLEPAEDAALPEESMPTPEEGGPALSAAGAGQSAKSAAYTKSMQSMDLAALQALNADIKGWIVIPNTKVSYPLLQGGDNSYYLKHSYKKGANSAGAIFLDYRNKSNLSDFNSIIYGHRMNNGSMFESLKNYKNYAYWAAHPYIYISLSGGRALEYQIFAAYEESASGQSYRTSFGGSLEAKQTFLNGAVGASYIQTGVQVNGHDQILTLSTCTSFGYDKRFVVHAKRTGGIEPQAVPPPAATPPGQEETPPEQEAAPPEQEETPLEQAATPPEQEETPPEQ